MENKLVENSGLLYHFDKVTSKNGTDWFLALTWIVIFELVSSIIEFKYLTIARTYVIAIEEGLFKEALIAAFVVLFVFHFVHSIVKMRQNDFYFLIMYAFLGLYFYVTKDITFNLLFHNIINPFELEFQGFGFYTIIQLVIKVIIIYLIYKIFISFKNNTNEN